MFFSVLLCLLVAYTNAQLPTACSSPPQFQCREILADRQQNFFERRRLYYDAENMRERKIEEVMEGTTRSFYDILTLYRENKEYIVDMATKKCNVTTPSRGFHHRGVFPGAHFDYEFTIGPAGVPGESLVAKAFSANSTDGTEAYFGMVSSPDCIPLQNVHFSKEYGVEESTYYDLVVGITDPMVFIPRSECTS